MEAAMEAENTIDPVRLALGCLEASDVHRALAARSVQVRRELARLLAVNEAALTRAPGAGRLVQRGAERASDEVVLVMAQALMADAQEQVMDELGDDAGDPTLEQLRDAVDAVIEATGPRLLALLLTVAVQQDWPAAPHCRELLDTDPRFAPDALEGTPDEPVEARPVPRRPRADEETRARRAERRRQQREARKAPIERPRYRRQAPRGRDDVDRHGTDETPVEEATSGVLVNGTPLSVGVGRSTVRLVGHYQDVRYDDPMVGRLVLAPITFVGPVDGVKDRPCVVVAASGRRHLVVRTCYSKGGRRGDDWRSVPITDLDAAGLDGPTSVSDEERLIARHEVRGEFGRLSDFDWNQL